MCLSVVEGRVNVMDVDLKELLERRTAEITSEVQERMVQVERLALRDTNFLHDLVYETATFLGDSLSKLEKRVDKVTVRVSALDELHKPLQKQSERVTNLEQWGDKLSEHLNECLDRVTNLEQWGEELAASF